MIKDCPFRKKKIEDGKVVEEFFMPCYRGCSFFTVKEYVFKPPYSNDNKVVKKIQHECNHPVHPFWLGEVDDEIK